MSILQNLTKFENRVFPFFSDLQMNHPFRGVALGTSALILCLGLVACEPTTPPSDSATEPPPPAKAEATASPEASATPEATPSPEATPTPEATPSAEVTSTSVTNTGSEAIPNTAPELTAAPSPEVPQIPLDAGKKVILMHYMPWYETPSVRGQWSPHWKGHQSQHKPETLGADGQPDIYSNYHPLIGLYDSADPDLLECHLLQMKLAGINGVIVDWYGISNTADFPKMQEASRAMFDATSKFGMKFVVCYEDRTIDLLIKWQKLQPDQVQDHLKETFQWMQTEWFSKPQYFKYNGRPLLLNFGPMYVKDPAVWSSAASSLTNPPALFGLHHLWKNAGMDGGFTWVHWNPWNGEPNAETAKKSLKGIFSEISGDHPERVIVSACPGFKDVYEQHHPELKHRDGQTLKEALEVDMKGPWPIIQLVTWNDYGEGTMIEPTHEFGYKFLDIIQAARKEEYGNSFKFTPEDLKLPARLYALRKKGGVPADALNKISRLLSEGNCSEAQSELKKLECSETEVSSNYQLMRRL
jgi:hypothetical protein